MRKPVFLFLIIAALFAGCRSSEQGKESENSAQAVVAAFFQEELVRCDSDAECLTGRCDLTPMFTISVSGGFCASFPNAYERWQRIELAESLAGLAREDPELMALVLARVDDELAHVRRPAEKEAVIVLLVRLGVPDAVARLRELSVREEEPIRRLAGLSLASIGDESGSDELVEASLSAVVRMRMHAAHSAGGLCKGAALSVLAELLVDKHYLVRQAAAAALARCGEEGKSVLEARSREISDGKAAYTGDRFAVDSALSAP